VFFLSVAESPTYSQENTFNYYQSSKSIKKKRFSTRNTKHIVFNKTVSGKAFLAFFFPSIHLKKAFQKQIQPIIKLQKQLYQKIALLHRQHIFLISKITTSNSISNIYIA
jgi:hypothetical protein